MANSKDVHLAGEILDRAGHIGAFFNSEEESYRILLPFIKEGFEQGNRTVHILGPAERDEHVRRLEQAGINVAEAEQKDQLVIRSWDNTYLQDGCIDVDRQIALIEELLADGIARGFKLTRLIARMEWALQDLPAVNQIAEHEGRLTQALEKYDGVVCWTYDLSKFSASAIIDTLRTHPLVLIGIVLHRNAFFVSPEELLREHRERPGPDIADASGESGQ